MNKLSNTYVPCIKKSNLHTPQLNLIRNFINYKAVHLFYTWEVSRKGVKSHLLYVWKGIYNVL